MSDKKSDIKDLREAFMEWLNSDNVVCSDDVYRCQCNQYRAGFNLFRLYRYFISNYGDFYLQNYYYSFKFRD